jgi:hypothetical protein
MNRVEAAQRGKSKAGAVAEAQRGAGPVERLRALTLTGLLIVVTLGIGWLVWSVLEWRHGRTASYRLTGLRVVRRSTGQPVGLARSVVRNAFLCTLLLIPTTVACIVVAVAFVMGASPPSGLLREPRSAPWDLLTNTMVVRERPRLNPSDLRLAKWPEEHAPASLN